jgi:hypothetical protein
LLAHHAAAPAVDDVGTIRRLQQRGELLLVRFVLEILDVDPHAGMARHEALRDLLPEPARLRILFDVQHLDRDFGGTGGRDADRERERRDANSIQNHVWCRLDLLSGRARRRYG